MIEIATKEELVAMLPELFRQIIEYPEIMKAWAEGLGMAGGLEQQVWDNLYVQTCDEPTLEQYEALLGLVPAPGDSLDVRRQRVLSRLAISIPYSERKMRSVFDEIFGAGTYTLTVDTANQSVDMSFNVHIDGAILTFCTTWYSMAPAHMAFTVNEDITTDIDGNMYFGGCVDCTEYTNIA